MYVHVPVSVLYKHMSEEVGFFGTCEYALNQHVAMEPCRDALHVCGRIWPSESLSEKVSWQNHQRSCFFFDNPKNAP